MAYRLLRRLNGKNLSCKQCSYAYSTAPEMPDCDFKPAPYKGMTYDDAVKIRQENLTPALLTYYKKPVMVSQGHMQWLYDIEGKRYLDMFGGIVTVSVGHCHPKVTERAKDQLGKLWHTTNIYLHPTIHEYAEKLASKLPGNLKVVYFTNSGSEANDLAVLMARMHTGVFDIVSLRNAYHGASPYLMGLTAMSSWRFNVPTGFGIHQIVGRPCDCGEGECKAGIKYAEQLEDVIRFSMPKDKMGGLFIESMQGVGGAVQFPKNFVKRAFEAVRSRGGVCISDEVQTGFGRLGSHFWGFETHGVMPDIVTMAKGIGNGFPLAAVVTTPEIAKSMGKALHFNTYGGNPVGCAVGSTVLDVIEEENIQEKCVTLGTYCILELRKLMEEFPIVGDVRGKGLMIGVELVKDRETKEPLSADKVNAIWEEIKDMGILVGKGGIFSTVLRIKPPMCITKEDVDFTVAVIRAALRKHS